MGPRLTAGLLVLILVGGAILYWDPESRTLLTAAVTGVLPDPTGDEVALLVPLRPAAVTAIELVHADTRLTIRREQGKWPDSVPATAVDYFLENVANVGRIGDVEVEPDALVDFGLAPPERHLILQQEASEPGRIHIEIGKANPPGTAVYTRIDGQGPVRIAGSVLVWEFDRLIERVARHREAS